MFVSHLQIVEACCFARNHVSDMRPFRILWYFVSNIRFRNKYVRYWFVWYFFSRNFQIMFFNGNLLFDIFLCTNKYFLDSEICLCFRISFSFRNNLIQLWGSPTWIPGWRFINPASHQKINISFRALLVLFLHVCAPVSLQNVCSLVGILIAVSILRSFNFVGESCDQGFFSITRAWEWNIHLLLRLY